MNGININVLHGDAIDIVADVLVLKYAQNPYGLDRDIIQKFDRIGNPINKHLPKIWDFYQTETQNITKTKRLIFIGVPNLRQFGYKEIREFGRKSLEALASTLPNTKSIIFTIHGPGYGLDEVEAFKAQIAGIYDSILSDDYPEVLEEITFIERSNGRAKRLKKVLDEIFYQDSIPKSKTDIPKIKTSSLETLRSAGYESESKKNAFVAMPFSPEFDDIFHYGIQGAVNNSGCLCERADLESFTGDVMEWVKSRITKSSFIIADLSGANPNVYLEIGYAWGLNKPTLLLINDTKELKFDVRGQRCISYSNIKDLENKLTNELNKLVL